MKYFFTVVLLLLKFLSFSQTNSDLLAKLKAESESNSQVMRSVSYLSDVYGPRLMGTSNYFNSLVWAEQQLWAWGIQKTQRQSFDKNYRGWEVVSFSVFMESPSHSSLSVYPLAYTDSGKGTGEVINLSKSDSIYTLIDQLRGKLFYSVNLTGWLNLPSILLKD